MNDVLGLKNTLKRKEGSLYDLIMLFIIIWEELCELFFFLLRAAPLRDKGNPVSPPAGATALSVVSNRANNFTNQLSQVTDDR